MAGAASHLCFNHDNDAAAPDSLISCLQAAAMTRRMPRGNVSNLRHKLERIPAKPQYIITEPGVGCLLKVK